LDEPYPNPSAGKGVTFTYELPRDASVSLEIFDVAGRRVHSIVREQGTAGRRTVFFDGRDDTGGRLGSGVYFARLVVDGPMIRESAVRKFSLVR
jgi:hypothetical protein